MQLQKNAHRFGVALLVALTFGGGALEAGAKTFAWPGYVTRYHDGKKIAVAHGGVHGINQSGDWYFSGYIRDPNGTGSPVYGRLSYGPNHVGPSIAKTTSTNSKTYVLRRRTIGYNDKWTYPRTRAGVCELRSGIVPDRCADGAWKVQWKNGR